MQKETASSPKTNRLEEFGNWTVKFRGVGVTLSVFRKTRKKAVQKILREYPGMPFDLVKK